MNANTACLPPGARLRLFAAVLASCAPIVCSRAQQKLEDVALPKAETWMAECKDAFAFRHAPQREDVAWFVARMRQDLVADKPGQYLVAWSERGGGEVHSVDLGNDLCNEDWFAGPVWNHQADRIAVAIAVKDGRASKIKVVVIDTKAATAQTWIEDVYPPSLSWAGDGRTLAVGDAQSVHVMKGPADEAYRLEFPSGRGWGAAASISPDGTRVLAVSEAGVFLLARGDKPERLGDVEGNATIFTAPQWSPDATQALAVAGGTVTLIDVGKKSVCRVGEKTLGGRAHAAVWVPGTAHALAFVEQVRDGSAIELFLGAGHAPKKYSALPVLVAGGGDVVLALKKLSTATPDARYTHWIYRPQLSEALSRWSR